MINKKICNDIAWKDDSIHSIHRWIESRDYRRIDLRIYFSHGKPESCLEMGVEYALYDICIKAMKKDNDSKIHKISSVSSHIKLNRKAVNCNFTLLLKKAMEVKRMTTQLENVCELCYIETNSLNFHRSCEPFCVRRNLCFFCFQENHRGQDYKMKVKWSMKQ